MESALGRFIGSRDELYHSMIGLKHVGLWPASNLLQIASLEEVSARISQLGPCPSSSGQCACVRIRASLEQAADDAKKQQQGLCLNCVGMGKVTRDGGNCLADLPHLCKLHEQADSMSFFKSPSDGG